MGFYLTSCFMTRRIFLFKCKRQNGPLLATYRYCNEVVANYSVCFHVRVNIKETISSLLIFIIVLSSFAFAESDSIKVDGTKKRF